MSFTIAGLLDDPPIPSSSSILITGPPGSGKSVLCRSILTDYLRSGAHCVFVTLNEPPSQIRQEIANNASKSLLDNFILVDGYSWLQGESSEHISVRTLTNLSDLSVKIFMAYESAKGSPMLVLDSMSNLLTYNSENEVVRFMEVNIARLRKLSSPSLFIVEDGIHTPSFYKMLFHLVDGVLETRLEESKSTKRQIRIHKFRRLHHPMVWFDFEIVNTGKVVIHRK